MHYRAARLEASFLMMRLAGDDGRNMPHARRPGLYGRA